MWPIAQEVQRVYGFHPSITITQAAHESNWGQSGLVAKANNLYGIKATTDWIQAGLPTYDLPTKEFTGGRWIETVARWRKYDSWLQSAMDWAFRISTLPRYAEAAEAARKGDIKEYGEKIYKGGYATDPAYPAKIVNVSAMVSREGAAAGIPV